MFWLSKKARIWAKFCFRVNIPQITTLFDVMMGRILSALGIKGPPCLCFHSTLDIVSQVLHTGTSPTKSTVIKNEVFAAYLGCFRSHDFRGQRVQPHVSQEAREVQLIVRFLS